jgi:hypothetical protein
MPSKRKLSIVIAAGLLIITGVWFIVLGWKTQTYANGTISGGRLVRALSYFSAHSSEECYLEIKGVTFRNVRGLAPYYLDIPECHWILFVTENLRERATINILRRDTNELTRIYAGTCSFGNHIGSKRQAGEAFTDYVGGITNGMLFLVSRYLDGKNVYVIDLAKKRVERIDRYDYNQDGKVIDQETYPSSILFQ